jgi:hypothetical protein
VASPGPASSTRRFPPFLVSAPITDFDPPRSVGVGARSGILLASAWWSASLGAGAQVCAAAMVERDVRNRADSGCLRGRRTGQSGCAPTRASNSEAVHPDSEGDRRPQPKCRRRPVLRAAQASPPSVPQPSCGNLVSQLGRKIDKTLNLCVMLPTCGASRPIFLDRGRVKLRQHSSTKSVSNWKASVIN